MTLRIIRLGEPRDPREGTRVGTARRPPRGVPKERYSPDDWFDVWFPDLAPSAKLTEWKRFVRAFKAEMNVPTAPRALGLLAALSHGTNLSIGTAKARPAATGLCFVNC